MNALDITPLFKMADIGDEPLSITETAGMYPYKSSVEENWAYYTAVGMKRLKTLIDSEETRVKEIGIVGIGSGIEGIAITRIFKESLRRLIITDIDQEILDGAVINIQKEAQSTECALVPLMGSFCEPIARAGLFVDLVHANIPNLPAIGTEDLEGGAEKGTFIPPSLYKNYAPPNEFINWALAAQYAYLQSAKQVLQPGGSIVTELGGRVPNEMVLKLFEACDLTLQEIIVGFKKQTEALIDFEGYHRLERTHGARFTFYRFAESQLLLEKHGIENPTWNANGEEVKKLLKPYEVSAGEALALHHQNIPVGHIVHLYRGMLK